MQESLIIAGIVIYFLAGVVKGTLGIGFPTAAIAMFSLFVDARSAVAYVVIPMCVTNIWQIYRSGIMGGLAGVWAPMIITYLYARRVSPAEFVQAVGVFLLLGSLVLLVGLSHTGVINTGNAPFSAFLVLPALLGFSIGEQLRAGLDRETFEKIILVFFLVIGLNLFRRAVFVM